MYAIYYVYACLILGLVIVARIYFTMFCTHKTKGTILVRNNPVKTMIILGSGGHTAEMIRILECLNFENYSPRIYIYADTDLMSIEKVKNLERNNVDYKTIKIRRSREIHQSYYTSVYTTLCATLESIPHLWRERPELLLCNGPGTCVPLCVIAFFFKIFYIMKITVIYVESFCRVKTLSLTGKILYYIADYQIVQWPYLYSYYNCYFQKMSNYTSIAKLIPWDLLQGNIQNHLPIEMKMHLITMVTSLKNFIENEMIPPMKWTADSLILVDACLDKTWEALNSGHWQFVPLEYRYCYSLCTILKAVLLEFECDGNTTDSTKATGVLKSIIQQIDKGILLGAPLPNVTYLLPKIASELNNCTTKSVEILDLEELIVDSKNLYDSVLPGFNEVAHYVEPSMELFYKKIFMPKVPAILKDCIKHWKALSQWKNLKYLIKVAGNRIVPIEIGSRYTDENWTQQLLSFSEFLQKYVLTKGDQVGYLAQHQLFDQIPELKDDFTVPEYCNFTDNEDVEQPDINAWFGPSGTVSPLHFDPKNNLLCQVFGYKRVILYPPSDSSNLYPYDTRLLNNTAQVDPLNPDYEKWPNFRQTKSLMSYLKPGEVLYIPPKWWHHVTSLTPSFSISFWWN